MASFYYGRDQGQGYWINLDQICFVKIEPDRLILKMVGETSIAVQGEDYKPLKQLLWDHTIIWSEEFKDNDKRHNHEDVPTREEVEASNDAFELEDCQSETCDLDDQDIPIQPNRTLSATAEGMGLGSKPDPSPRVPFWKISG